MVLVILFTSFSEIGFDFVAFSISVLIFRWISWKVKNILTKTNSGHLFQKN